MRTLPALPALLLLLLPGASRAAATFTAQLQPITDEKAVFATVESRNVVPARARIGGTVIELSVHDGDEVKQGQTIAMIGDEKLQLQIRALDAQIKGLQAQLAQARIDFDRLNTLARTGAASRQALDQARTAVDVANSALAAQTAQRAVVAQQMTEGAVLAPTAGRVLQVPVTKGTVRMPGEPVAQIAEADYVLRLAVPERHAQQLKAGDMIRVDGADLGRQGPVFGKVTLVYPMIKDGRVIADATAPGVGSYFVGNRVLVWIAAGQRPSFVIPSSFIITRFGLSYVRRKLPGGLVEDIPVQRGRDLPTPAMPNGIEILAGLQNGDQLVAP